MIFVLLVFICFILNINEIRIIDERLRLETTVSALSKYYLFIFFFVCNVIEKSFYMR